MSGWTRSPSATRRSAAPIEPGAGNARCLPRSALDGGLRDGIGAVDVSAVLPHEGCATGTATGSVLSPGAVRKPAKPHSDVLDCGPIDRQGRDFTAQTTIAYLRNGRLVSMRPRDLSQL